MKEIQMTLSLHPKRITNRQICELTHLKTLPRTRRIVFSILLLALSPQNSFSCIYCYNAFHQGQPKICFLGEGLYLVIAETSQECLQCHRGAHTFTFLPGHLVNLFFFFFFLFFTPFGPESISKITKKNVLIKNFAYSI